MLVSGPRQGCTCSTRRRRDCSWSNVPKPSCARRCASSKVGLASASAPSELGTIRRCVPAEPAGHANAVSASAAAICDAKHCWHHKDLPRHSSAGAPHVRRGGATNKFLRCSRYQGDIPKKSFSSVSSPINPHISVAHIWDARQGQESANRSRAASFCGRRSLVPTASASLRVQTMGSCGSGILRREDKSASYIRRRQRG